MAALDVDLETHTNSRPPHDAMHARAYQNRAHASRFAVWGACLVSACGPSGSSGESAGRGTGSATRSTSTSDANASGGADLTSAGKDVPPTACGNGIKEEGEWCHQRLVADGFPTTNPNIDPNERYLFQVARGTMEEGPDTFVVAGNGAWSIGIENPDSSTLRVEQSYIPPFIDGDSALKLFPAKVGYSGRKRTEFVFFHPEGPSAAPPGPSCQTRAFFRPGPARYWDPSHIIPPDMQFHGLDCERDGLIVPLEVLTSRADWYFAADSQTKLGGLYSYEPTEDSSPYALPSGIYSPELTQTFEQLTECNLAFLRSGDTDGDGSEDILLYGNRCPSQEADELVLIDSIGDGLAAEPQRLAISPPGEVLRVELADLDGNGSSTPVLVGEGFLEAVELGDRTSASLRSLEASPASFPASAADDDEGSTTQFLEFGNFDDEAGSETVVHVEDGVAVVSLFHGTIHTATESAPIRSYAVADINDDGISDLALLLFNRVVVYVSNP